MKHCIALPQPKRTRRNRQKLLFLQHQSGHIAAALYSAGRLSYFERPFYAFHVSGGTTEALYLSSGLGWGVGVAVYALSSFLCGCREWWNARA